MKRLFLFLILHRTNFTHLFKNSVLNSAKLKVNQSQ